MASLDLLGEIRTINYCSSYDLYNSLLHEYKEFDKTIEKKGIPLFLLFPCDSPYDMPDLTKRTPNGVGETLYFPRSISDFRKMVAKESKAKQNYISMYKYIKCFKVKDENINMEKSVPFHMAKDEPRMKWKAATKPRNISQISQSCFILHKRVRAEFSEILNEFQTNFNDFSQSIRETAIVPKLEAELENILKIHRKYDQAKKTAESTVKKVYETLEVLNYGPKAVSVSIALDATVRRGLIEALKSSDLQSFCSDNDKFSALMQCVLELEVLEEKLSECSKNLSAKLSKCYGLFREIYQHSEEKELIMETMGLLQEMELNLDGVVNQINEEIVLVNKRTDELVFSSQLSL